MHKRGIKPSAPCIGAHQTFQGGGSQAAEPIAAEPIAADSGAAHGDATQAAGSLKIAGFSTS
ncbi:MAG: hypothetical protein AB7S68_19170 [Polyangiaceae bacterium]